MRSLLICLIFICFSCKSQKNKRDIEEIQRVSEDIGKIRYQISLLILHPNLKLDMDKIDSLYYKLK
jgi:hypothetical protein